MKTNSRTPGTLKKKLKLLRNSETGMWLARESSSEQNRRKGSEKGSLLDLGTLPDKLQIKA
jgi:hypothetical protein